MMKCMSSHPKPLSFCISRLFKFAHEVLASGYSLKMATEPKTHEKNLLGSNGGSFCSTDAEESSLHSTYVSNSGCGSYDECGFSGVSASEIGAVSESSLLDCCSDVDLESGASEIKDRDCRICRLSMESPNQESGIPIELGCSCKGDLAIAHKQCAETWFKIKGNGTCEICGATALNVFTVTELEITEQRVGTSNVIAVPQAETRIFWRGHRFLNFLLACMVFAFVISWLFHFNVPS